MVTGRFYDSPQWRELRAFALERDSNRCIVARLFGGVCSETLHVHHIESVEDRPDLALELDNVATVCETHHPTWEALRRYLRRKREWRRCPHEHRTKAGRDACEQRLNRELVAQRERAEGIRS